MSHAVALREKGVHIIAQWRLPVVKIKEILGLHHPDSLSGRVITRSLDISPTTITNVLSRAKTFDLEWPLPKDLEDDDSG